MDTSSSYEVSSVFADPNTRQEYQVEGEISHEAVTDTSSDSEENRNGNIQPENKLQQKDEYWRYIPLVKAALAGNWEIAKRFFDQDKVACTVPITKFLETALHIAVGTGKALHFVEKLVEAMPLEAITLCDDKGFTALHTAALGGNTAAAMILVKKHSALLHIRGGRDKLSIHVAAMHGHKETLCYLLRVTKDDPASKAYQGESGNWLLKFIMASKFYDVALDLIHRYPELATSKDKFGNLALASLAAKPSAFPSGSRLNFWQRRIYSCVPESCSKDHNRGDIENPINMSPKYNWAPFLGANFCISAHKVSQKLHFILWKVFEFAAPQIKDIREKKQKHNQALQLAKCLCKAIQSLNDSDAYESHAKVPLFKAAKLGVHEVVEEIVDSFPSLVWATDSNEYSIFHHAIVQRHENVYNLLYQMSEHKRFMTYFRDNDNNTKLHLAGKLAPQNKLNLVPGAALQMQRELQWFEEVKKFVIPYQMDWRNRNQDTAEMVFTNAHKELLVEGEKWMTHTANSCTIVAALIVTIAFAASISVPGGHNDVKGLPILSNEAAFIVFAISNAFSLFTSTTSLMMFLSILTSTYSEKDFLFALPKRLIIGLVTLFFSITTMMVAFSSIVYLLFGYNKRWVLIPTGVFSGIPIISFVFLEFPLLLDLITSYGGGIFGKKSNRLFY
ncbi:ankyrin repeat-containing protein NPR4-like isoform X2 [Actinidia eriantha]|uniref:ankyrin repeat-containing protein NPR4-like isoform X2 n=1 Tax=Actinidia eriantha TaxID=165200 RepID=UPI0025868BB4|nr:ankyrin repeat-containing protein NPR4-like isoform X2 [Actinidia eriantha]